MCCGKSKTRTLIAIDWAKKNNALPDNLVTVFAGMEKEAVE